MGEAAVTAPASPGGVRTATAELVATTDASNFLPPSPDPAGIVWIASEQRLLVSDSEVNETPFFAGSNLYWVSLSGALLDHGSAISYSKEPTGLGFDPSGNRLFVSDDNKDEIYEVRPGPDGRFGTGDDLVTSFDTEVFGSTDPEGVEFDPVTGDLFIVDGLGTEVYRVHAGPNGLFDGVDNDDVVTSFDLGALGSFDPEGIGLDTVRGVLVVVDKPSALVFEITKTGELVRVIDISAADPHLAAGVALAPGSLVPTDTNLYVVDRGVDNSEEPDQNDGKIHELRVVSPPGDPFVDDNNSVHEGFINALAAAGITTGCNPPASTLFCPRDLVTRAQMASFLERAFDLEPVATDSFVDDTGSVHEDAINAIAAVGITLGCNPPLNDQFCPEDAVTRAQMASLLVRGFGLAPGPVDAFVDDTGSVHEDDINSLAAVGITLGCNPPLNDQFCPTRPVTREEMASLLGRALELDPLPVL
jgi:DNA-binding beta-propeller fold protein YncE